ncbi:MAG: hypothetical protein QXO55_01040 [Candidatus Korarchaeum sp.]
MSIKDIARILGSAYAQLSEIERELKHAILSGLEIERLLYSFSKVAEADINRLREEIVSSLGESGEEVSEAIRRSLRRQGRRTVGGRRCAIILTSLMPGLTEEMERLRNEVRGGYLKLFDATAYPLASVMEAVEYDPNYVIFVSGGGAASLMEIGIPEPRGSDELNELISLSLLGVNRVDVLAGIMGPLSRRRKSMWLLSCDEGRVGECVRMLRELLMNLGFSF